MLSFNNAPGNLFNRLGRLGKLVTQAGSYQSSQNTNFTDGTNGALVQFASEPDIQAILGSNYKSILNGAGAAGSLASNVASQIIIRMVQEDNPQISANIILAIQEVIRQMKVAGAAVLQMTVGATPTVFSGTGNGVVVASAKAPNGLPLENAFAENVLLSCTADSYSGNATAGNESFSLSGAAAETNFFNADWPLGSGSSTSLSAISGASNSQGNGLTNGSLENWSANIPANFAIETGAATIFREQGIVYDGTSSLRLTGDGSTLSAFSQSFNSTSGTTARLAPSTQYSFNLFARRDGTAAGAGQLIVELTDSSGVPILDSAGTVNNLTVSLTGLTTNFAAYNTTFRTPTQLPATAKIRFRLSTALTTGRSVYFDRLSMGLMSQLGPSQIFAAVHSGSVPFAAGDRATITTSNSRGAGGTLNTFQTLLARLLSVMISSQFLLPSSNTPTINDGLITS